MDAEFASQSLGARMVAIAQMAAGMHASMNLLGEESSNFTVRQRAKIGGTDRCVTDDTQFFVAGENEG